MRWFGLVSGPGQAVGRQLAAVLGASSAKLKLKGIDGRSRTQAGQGQHRDRGGLELLVYTCDLRRCVRAVGACLWCFCVSGVMCRCADMYMCDVCAGCDRLRCVTCDDMR